MVLTHSPAGLGAGDKQQPLSTREGPAEASDVVEVDPFGANAAKFVLPEAVNVAAGGHDLICGHTTPE